MHLAAKQKDAKGLEEANQYRSQKRPEWTPHAPDYHHHEGIGDGIRIHGSGQGQARDLKGTGQARQPGTEDKHTCEEPGLVYSQGPNHLPVRGGCADQDPPSGAVKDLPKSQSQGGS